MKKVSVIVLIGLCALILLTSGCADPEKQRLIDQNHRLSSELGKVTRERDSNELLLKQCQERLATADKLNTPEMQALKDKILLLQEEINTKVDLIKRMKGELLRGTPQLPIELNIALKDFADNNEMVSYDEATGMLKFKSDLLFSSGSAKVLESAKEGLSLLTDIMNSEAAKDFDLVIAGHTDSDPIKYSKHLHATNWHLSSHRAIAVLEEMVSKGISPKRLSARGFGEQRPVAPNDTKESKATNRRVEIYVVSKGM